ncbi:hypothetical protein [Streptomyces sp. NRRL S-1813]|uniref:hypothetical protein n=1 Tax=Streptomyces sp. NRRL S-1813 TaxID=1463888 RepID=UPI0004C4AAF8|nr:hypothetical protein [Streptomyces sp. NRRL S-1813]
MVTAVLDVMCAMGLVGVALVTGMADVAQPGRRDGRRRGGRPGSPAYALPGDRGRPARWRLPHSRPGRGGCAAARGRGDVL